jgi:hypothetical protein
MHAEPEGPPELRRRHELDAAVANIELTLISIVQGVALYFLANSAGLAVANGEWASLPQVAVGLIVILIVWSRSVMHAFTVIRWPIEFGHNFFYILITLLEAIHFTQIGRPVPWFATGSAYVAVAWALFAWDRHLFAARRVDSAGPNALKMLDVLEAEHMANLRVAMPITLAVWVGCTFAVWRWPAAATPLTVAQMIGLAGYLAQTLRVFASSASLVLAARRELEGG